MKTIFLNGFNLSVSSDGCIYKNGIISKVYLDKYGYNYITLCHKQNNKKYKVHRIVALAFLGENKLQVHHKNNIKTDNRIENLEYVTHIQNDFYKWTNDRNAELKYIGVTRFNNKYRAQIQVKNKKIHLGYFKTQKVAHAYYMFVKKDLL